MYNIIKSVIDSGCDELADVLKKIDTIWLQGDITDAERTELIALAREKADPENSYADLQQQIDALRKELAAHEERIKTLEGTETVPTEAYPAWVQPTGAHDAYFNGDGMTFTDGYKYDCIAPEGVAVVWGPDVYPAYWQKVEEGE